MTLTGLLTLLLCCVQLINCSHFRGALITWSPVTDENVDGLFSVHVRFRISWRKSSGGHYCDSTIIQEQTLIGDASSLCTSNSVRACEALYYYCTDYSDEDDWTSGRNDFIITSETEQFNLTFAGNAWVHAGNWMFVSMVDLRPRPDNGEINSSPTVEIAPVINLQRGCTHTITLPVSDVDGDTVRCRWAIGTECADVCYGNTQNTALPSTNLDQNSCSITYEAPLSDSNTFYAVALQVEDFINSTSVIPLSSVPVQFLVKLYTSDTSSCANEPEFVPPTPENGQCFVIDVGEEFNVNVTVRGAHNFSAITTTSAVGMEHSTEKWWRDDTWYYMSLIITWIPTEDDAEQDHSLCFYARDITGIYNTPRCINVPVAVPAPIITSVERIGTTNTWTIKFDRTFSLPETHVDITVIETATTNTVFTMGTEDTEDVVFDPDHKLVRITINHGFDPAKDYHVIVPEGLVRRAGDCNALSPGISDETFWKIEINCGPTDPINNGIVTTPNGTDHPHAAVFQCNHGYKLYGDSKRQCLVTAVWGGEDPKCDVPVCPDPTVPANGIIASSNGTTYTSTLHFKCNDGYLLVGSEISQCTIEAVWSTPTSTCIKKVDIGSPCNTSDICRPYLAQCINSTCMCKTGIYNLMADTCDAMKLYPYGLDNGDKVIDNTEDFCIPIEYQYPIFDVVPKIIYVCSNGLVSVGQEYLDTWPSKFIGNNILAPLFADTEGGYVNLRSFDIQEDDPSGLNSDEVKDVQSMVEKLASVKNFKTVFILFATWNKVQPVQDIFDQSKESTFQLVLVTDGSNTFAFYIYGHGLMQWSLLSNSKLGPAVWIGYSSLPKYKYTNIYSFTSDVTTMDVHATEQGISGLSFSRLTDVNTSPPSDVVKCMTWYNANSHLMDKVKSMSDKLPECPCDRTSLSLDQTFVQYTAAPDEYACAELKFGKNFETFGKTCCYDKKGLWIKEAPNAGGIQIFSQESSPEKHWINDIDAKQRCCSSPLSRACERYYELHPIGKCYTRSNKKIAGCHGDPHFKTPDGGNFTFNGFGEYTLLNIDSTDNDTGVTTKFDLQARTDRAIRDDGTLSFATRFRAFAAKDHTNASFHIELNDAEDGYTLFANGADLSLQYRGASGARSFNYTPAEGNIVLHKLRNVLVVLFTQTDISLNVTIGVKMLSLSMTIHEKYKTMTRGLLGNFDDDPGNDFVTPAGETRPSEMSEEDIFHYAQLWEIDPDQSAFIYTEGKNHSHYHNPSYVPKFLIDADDNKVQDAYGVCGGSENMQCVFDYVFTEDEDVAGDTKSREIEIEYIKKTNNQTVPNVDVCDMVYVKRGEKATCAISIGDAPSVKVNVTKTSPRGNVVYNPTDNVVSFTIEDTTPDIISVTVSNNDDRFTEANITVVICTGCSQHGECIHEVRDDVNQTTHFKYQVCKCEPQYEGIDCEFEFDGCKAKPCSSLRECTTLNATEQISMNVSYLCGPCPEGFEDNGTKCKDIDECAMNTSDCQHTCTNNAGSFECSCYNGFRISATNNHQCIDINECDEVLHTCTHICSNGDGNYSCSCFEKYVFNETTGDCVLGGDNDVCDVGLDCSNTTGCTIDEHGDPTCFCKTGLKLTTDGTNCDDMDECDQNICPQACVNTYGSFSCECYHGYNFSDGECTQCVFPNWGKDCQSECSCSSTTTLECDPVQGCMCSNGWHGDLCDLDTDECEEYPCSSTLQECVNVPGSYQCICVEGYEFSEEDQLCHDKDECSRPDLHDCNQTCTNHVGGYSCSCEEGFVLFNKTLCRDIDDCDVGTSECEQLCVSGEFIAGSYNCYCHYGYLINDDRRTCRKDPNVRDDCEENNLICSHFCKPHRNPKQSECQCKKGYKLAVDLETCLDVDECSDPTLNKCEDIAECYNEVGSYRCECPVGTMLSNNQRTCQECDAFHYGKECAHECSCLHGACHPVTGCQCSIGWSGEHCDKDNDECGLPTTCTQDAGMECRNTPGSYVCQCKAGYFENTTEICSDYDECNEFKLHQCDQKCVNMQGSYRCECAHGFKHTNGRCEDLDECKGVSGCDHYCTNTIGSYRCTCREGFKLNTTNRQTCTPEVDCTADNETYCDDRNASCSMINGQPECICYKGYEKESSDSDVCVDIKECSEQPKRCQHECVEVEGGFDCRCNPGYYLLDDGVGCQECSTGFYGLNCDNACECDMDNTVTCVPENGTCVCAHGWESETCNTDIDECEVSSDVCVENSVCMNTNGSYMCTCEVGYFKSGSGECEACDPQRYGQGCTMTCACDMEHTLICDSTNGICECLKGWEGDNCTDNIIECANETICSYKENSECVDTPGSYACQCKDGYASQNDQCEEIDECFEGTDDCDQDCVNTNGSYICQCYPGYEGYWNDCEECSGNTFGFNCSETCACIIDNSLNSTQSCIPSNGTCVCRDEWTGTTCDDDVNECVEDASICEDDANTGCNNTLEGYECLCLRGFGRPDNESPCEAVVDQGVQLPVGWSSIPFSTSLAVPLPPDVNLALASVFDGIRQKLLTALTTFTKLYTDKPFRITIIDIRRGSIEVDFEISYDGKTSDIADQLAYVAIDLAAGEEIEYDGQNVSIISTQFEDGTDACFIYTNTLHDCHTLYECAIEDGRPVCRLKLFRDNLGLILGLTIGLVFVVLVGIVIVFCGCKLRQETKHKKLRSKELLRQREQQKIRSGTLEGWQYDGRGWSPVMEPESMFTKSQTKQHSPNRSGQYRSSRPADNRQSTRPDHRSSRRDNFEDNDDDMQRHSPSRWERHRSFSPVDHGRSKRPDHRSSRPDHRSSRPDHRSSRPDHRPSRHDNDDNEWFY